MDNLFYSFNVGSTTGGRTRTPSMLSYKDVNDPRFFLVISSVAQGLGAVNATSPSYTSINWINNSKL